MDDMILLDLFLQRAWIAGAFKDLTSEMLPSQFRLKSDKCKYF